MRVSGWKRMWAAILATTTVLIGGSALAAGWPYALSGQPLVQAPRVCASGVAPLNRRCKVIDFAKLGVVDHKAWYYAF